MAAAEAMAMITCRAKLVWRIGTLLQTVGFTVALVVWGGAPWALAGVIMSLAEAIFFLVTRLALDGDELSYVAVDRRWRRFDLAGVETIRVDWPFVGSGLPIFPRDLWFRSPRGGSSFTPLWWSGWESLLVAAVDRAMSHNPDVQISAGARRALAKARRRLGLPHEPAGG